VPDRHTLAETERAMSDHVGRLPLDFPAANALSSLFRAANAVRNHLTTTVLREHDLTWTGFVVLWVAWIWDGMESRHVAESAGISKGTLTGVVKTLESRGWVIREIGIHDRRLVTISLTPTGTRLMEHLYPEFNAIEAEIVAGFSSRRLTEMTNGLRALVTRLEDPAFGAVSLKGAASRRR